MLVLALDTSTPDLIVGIVDSATGTTLAQTIIEDTRAHNEQLTPTVKKTLLDATLSFSDLDAVVVGCGPGPFTGLRVGMVSGAAFGDALEIPVFGVCSLDAIAHNIGAQDIAHALVATDARRREIYWATYRAGQREQGPDVVAPADLDIGGDVNAISIPSHLVEKLSVDLQEKTLLPGKPAPASLVAVADLTATPKPLVPLYLRRPDAKEPKPKPKSAAIPEVDLS
ncbi:M22 family O-sialoglycoprotein endopeptidase [Corynebacterium suranareeae]|uniref:M22 family O-sialoglycoprotein endopeptidase n=1 Tax=Corynebacterium suranareeae TaxID=2506452 RepID=A0A160PPX3_9CORY|nr:tRNA (adenosine(37)-N6)-threonylcarbamoyltransferase complex dimerization subunit type 1 TsaB [Corynebacterium suranareeae]BAU94993.1 M22 family O-sialoglycoprotein endopeptidase [Corynebacterium suranareeae]